jgi:hypothetical protein
MGKDYTPYQQKVIRQFYENRDQIDEQRLSELVTNLYLAEGKRKLDKMWKSAEEIMTRLKVPPARVEHVVATRDPAILAEVVKDIQSGLIQR